MKAQEFLEKLQGWIAQSPENGHAEVFLRTDSEVCFQFGAADDTRTMEKDHLLVLSPLPGGAAFPVKVLRKM